MLIKAKSTTEYLKKLPPERRADVVTVRNVIKKNLPKGYQETLQYGMIAYIVPESVVPAASTYNGLPLDYIGLASQKNYLSLYLMTVYGHRETEAWFRREYAKSGKRLNMGKSCLRFKHADDIPLDLIGKVVARTSVKEYVRIYERGLVSMRTAKERRARAKRA